MTPTDIGIIAWWLFVAVMVVRFLFKRTKDDEGYREYIDQLEAQRIAQAQAEQQQRERRWQELNSEALRQQHEQGFYILRGSSSDESKEVKRLKEQNKKLVERINYIENKE